MSTEAATCPHCGAPGKGASKSESAVAPVSPTPPSPPNNTAAKSDGVYATTQATGKKWKGLKLIALGAMVLGLVISFNTAGFSGLVIGAVGVVLLIYASLMSWWHHD